jgi:DNA replication protein DnaC
MKINFEQFLENLSKDYSANTKEDEREYNVQIMLNAVCKVGEFVVGKKYVIDDNNRKFWELSTSWMLNAKGGTLDVERGLLVFGQVGSGKTDAVKILTELYRAFYNQNFTTITALKIADLYQNNQHDQLERFVNCKNLSIDDLGAEPKSLKYYGSEILPMVDFTYKRYDHWKRNKGCKTIITTNYNDTMIGDNYGERALSRIAEITQCLLLTGLDRRFPKKEGL